MKVPFNISLGTMIGTRNWGKPQMEGTWQYIMEMEMQKINVKWLENFKSWNSKWRFHCNYDKQLKHTHSIFYVLESIKVDVCRGQSCTKYVHCARCWGCRHNPNSRTWSFSTGITCFPLKGAILLDKSLNLGQRLIFRYKWDAFFAILHNSLLIYCWYKPIIVNLIEVRGLFGK